MTQQAYHTEDKPNETEKVLGETYFKLLALEHDLERLNNTINHRFVYSSIKICEEIQKKIKQ